jgi:hypothetical protein
MVPEHATKVFILLICHILQQASLIPAQTHPKSNNSGVFDSDETDTALVIAAAIITLKTDRRQTGTSLSIDALSANQGTQGGPHNPAAQVGVSILGALANVTCAVRHISRRARQSGGASGCKHFGCACQCDVRRSSHWQACSTIRRRGWV